MRRMGIIATIVSLGLLGLVGASTAPAAAAGVKAVRVAGGLQSPVAFTIAPDGRLVYLERHTGWLRFRNLRTGRDQRVHRILNVKSDGERGALGVALHPGWPQQPFVYAFATRNTSSGLRNQVLRIKVRNGRGVGVRRLLSIAAGPAANHNGGRILFGPGGKLFVVVGDNADPANAQDRTNNMRGKILRINPDGSIPGDNPRGRIWAYGIRNSIGFAFDPLTGRLWQQDNGPSCNDEINRIVKGGNFAWGPNQDCPKTNNSGPTPRIRPKYTFVDTVGLTGVTFCDGCGLGPAYQGDLFVGAVTNGRIVRFDLGARRFSFEAGPQLVLDRPGPALSLEVGPNGRIYFSDFGAIYRLAPA
ncbi:MAG TPA: PQQ-dependent sugar dehydrogenase [Actinomycetota bacterium]|nr:PQQ-dependent sugar dehydrogenase [Actinomycetota bacterium]